MTEAANCRQNGFHCAENPLDCFTYYSNIHETVFCLVDAGGDVDEDDVDSKISCTELTIIRELSLKEVFLFGLAYMVDHPKRKWSSHVSKDTASARYGYAVVRGKDPVACGKVGDYLAFAKEAPDGTIVQIALAQVDGVDIRPDAWYDIDLKERSCI